MKKYILGISFLLATAAIYVNAQSKIMSLGFVAPQVKHLDEVYAPQEGEIVYQSTDQKFYGYNGHDPANPWVALSGSAGGSLPSGTIVPFAGSSAPDGFVIANGDTLNVDDHPELYAAIGTTYGGTGGPGGTFKLPNLQGVFIRGAGSQTISGVTYAGTFAAAQTDALQNITGSFASGFKEPTHPATIATGAITAVAGAQVGGQATTGATGAIFNFNAANSARTSTETRPANISLTYIIKL